MLPGCTVVHQVPIASMVADLYEIRRLSDRLWMDEVDDAELRGLASRPIPPPPGPSFEIGILRQAMARFVLGDRDGVLSSYKLATRNGGDLSRDVLVSLVAATETALGKTEAALRRYEKIEGRWLREAKGNHAAVVAATGRGTTIVAYLDLAIDTNPRVAERLLRSYPGDIDSIAGVSSDERLTYWLHFQGAKAHLAAKSGDYDRAYALVLDLLSGYRQRQGKAEPQDRRGADREEQLHKWLTLYSLGMGRYPQARRHLDEYEAARERNGHLRSGASRFHVVRAEYLSTIGDHQRALHAWESAWASVTRVERWQHFQVATMAMLHARAQLAAGDYAGAAGTLSRTDALDRLEGNIVRDYGAALKILAFAMGGQAMQDLRPLDELERQKYRRLGPQDELWRLGAKTVAYQRRGESSGRLDDIGRAVAGGREFSILFRKLRAAAFNHQAMLPQRVLEAVTESYLMAVISSIGRRGVTIDDLMDALGLAQMSVTDADISAAALRQGRIEGISTEGLRKLQDLQQAARAAREEFAMLSRASDSERNLLVALRDRSDEADVELQRYLKTLEEASPALRQALAVGWPGVGEARSRLGPDEALAVFVPTRRGTVALVMDGARNAEHRLLPPATADVSRLTRRVLASVVIDPVAGAPPFDFGAAKELHDALFGWNPRALGSARSLVVIAGGPLAAVPFGLLIRSGPGERRRDSHRTVPWLVKSFSVAHAPSLASWAAISGSPSRVRTDSFIAWADPDYGEAGVDSSLMAPVGVRRGLRPGDAGHGGSTGSTGRPFKGLGALLPRLPETRLEARAVARALGASSDDDVIAGRDATRSSVMRISDSGGLAYRSVVMFATHGLAARHVENLHQPALAMAREPGRPDPDLLQLDDVVRLRMNADWVILSACSTASADKEGGEMLSGLARGFFFAGARSLLVTHWDVESESAAAVTVKTMQHYASRGDITRAQALRRASLDLIEGRGTRNDWSHPAYWAAFSLIGQGGR